MLYIQKNYNFQRTIEIVKEMHFLESAIFIYKNTIFLYFFLFICKVQVKEKKTTKNIVFLQFISEQTKMGLAK